MYKLIISLIFLSLLHINEFVDINIDKNSRHFIDIEGRVRLFHGVNIVVKNPPYTPIEDNFDPLFSLSKEDYDYLVKFGFNAVRLGVIWEAVETEEGKYNEKYLEIYEKIINKLGSRGIYTILDSHQDMFSRILCGEGVPVFYAKNLISKKKCDSNYLEKALDVLGVCFSFDSKKVLSDDENIPLTEECKKQSFVDLHSVIELGDMYNSFFQNANNIQDKFVNYWKILAKKFKGNKYIIGYDIWNEPWVGNLFSEAKNFMPGYATNEHFLPFYKKVNDALRQIDEEFVLMFEEAIIPDTLPFFGGFYLGGYQQTPGGKNHLHKQIWSKHHYCQGYSIEISQLKAIPLDAAKNECKNFAEYKVRKGKEKANELGVSLFMTEFGACRDDESCYYDIKAVADACDKYLVSWAYWAYKPYGDHTTTCDGDTEGVFHPNGKRQDIKIKALTRPYIMAFQGNPIKSYFYSVLNIFHSKFILNSSIKSPTVFYFNKEFYFAKGVKFLIISHEYDLNHTHLQNSLIINSSNEFEINEKSILLKDWEGLQTIENNYLQVKIKNLHTEKPLINENLGPLSLVKNLVELLFCQKITYSINNFDTTILKKLSHDKIFTENEIFILIEDISGLNDMVSHENSNIVLLISNENIILDTFNKFDILVEYNQIEDYDHFEYSTEIIKHLTNKKEMIINQVFIPKMSIKILYNEDIIMQIQFENVLNHFIQIKI